MKLSVKEKQRIKRKYGEWAIVTGATSGMGRALAILLADAGLNIVIAGRDEQTLSALASLISSTSKVDVKTVVADFSHSTGVDTLIHCTKDLNAGLLVASAGFGTSGLFVENVIDDELNMLRVNCESVLRITYHYSQQFVNQSYGGIILMSSIVAFQGVPYAAHYAATKAYIQTLAEALSNELGDKGVDVLAAAPGPVHSGFADRARMKMSMALQPGQVAVPILRALGRRSTTFPGLLTKTLVYSLRLLPRWAKIKVMKVVMKGMTQHQGK